MVFKRNVTVTWACFITEGLISLIPTIFIIYLFFAPNKMHEIFSTLLIIPYFILIINALLIIISLIAQIFMKEKYYVNETDLVVESKTGVKTIKYNEIFGITYEFGYLAKFRSQPSLLVLFDKGYKQLLSINNPSLIMVHMIRKKCNNTDICYYNEKRFLHLFLSINITVLILLILIKFFP